MSTNVSDDWASFERATAEATRLNKIIVFDALSTAGITHVRVEFDGEGDQGQMRAAAAMNGDGVEFPPVTLTLRGSQYGSVERGTCQLSLEFAVEHICYGYLEERHGGWEINEGSFGEFNVDVVARTITLDFYGRIIETEHSSHTF